MKSLIELKERRGRAYEAMNRIVKDAKEEGREILNKEERERFNQFSSEYDELTENIQIARKHEERAKAEAERLDAEERAKFAAQKSGKDDEQKDPKEQYRDAFWTYAKKGLNGMTSVERDQMIAAKRAGGVQHRGTDPQITTTDAAGGYLVPTGFSEELERRMKFYGGMLTAPRIIRTATGETIDWPTLDDTSNTGSLLTEAAPSIAVNDLTFGQKQLDAYTYTTGIVKVSVQLMQDSFFNLEEVILDAFAERLGRIINQHLTTGTGSSQPNGFVTAVNAVSGTVNAADDVTLARADIVKLLHGVDRAYRNNNSAFMMHDSILSEVRQLGFGSSDDRPLYQQGNALAGEPDTLEGWPIVINNDMASALAADARIMAFGDWSKYVYRIVRDMTFVRLDERYMDSLQVGFIGYMRADGELIQDNAIKLLRNANT